MKSAKIVLAVFSVAVGVALLAFVAQGGLAFMQMDGKALDKESKEWVDEVVPNILSSWDADQVAKHASSEFLSAASEEDLDHFTSMLRDKYGPLVKYNGSSGESGKHLNVTNLVFVNTMISAEYVIEADFAKGSPRIFIQGVKRDGLWKIRVFHVTEDPALRWFGGQLTNQAPLEHAGDSAIINGTYYRKMWDGAN